MKQHTVKVEDTRNGKVTKVSLTKEGVTTFYRVSKKGNILDGDLHIGVLKRECLRWFDNQFKIVFNDK